MASTWREGFLILPRLLSPTEVDEFVNIIRGYLHVAELIEHNPGKNVKVESLATLHTVG